MHEPSDGVPPALLNHVHLTCTKQYAYHPVVLKIEDARNYLLQAAQVVRDHNPVFWQYLIHPKNGTMMLTWQPVNRMGRNFASDGYVWAGSEKLYSQDVGGFTIEVAVCETGFIPNQEAEAAHRRMRYRIVNGPNNAPYDASLEIVHYLESAAEHRVHSRAIRPHQHVQKQLQERAQLEKHGRLEPKQFMLHDKSNWPTITTPGQPANHYQNQISFSRGAQQLPPSYGGRPGTAGPSPAKRPRQGQSGMSMGGADGLPHPFGGQPGIRPLTDEEAVLLDEENPRTGDQFELITPAEISVTRYKQHHEWMEEVLSSPYAASQIIPVDLGLRLTGELGELTDVLWQTDATDAKATNGQADHLYQKPNEKNLEEFKERSNAFLSNGEEQLKQMRRAHAEMKEELTKQELFANLERRLAEAGTDGDIDEILHQAETLTASRIVARDEVQQIRKGGILSPEEQLPSPAPAALQQEESPAAALSATGAAEATPEVSIPDAVPPSEDFNELAHDDFNAAGEALDFFDTMDDIPA